MIARYAGGVSGAREAAKLEATVIVVDAYRASTTIAVLVSRGARVLPVASVREARRAKADVRVGERGSARIPGFDFGNSPTILQQADVRPGAVVALTTTNGTRIIEAAADAPCVLAGAFVNARAIAVELSQENRLPEIVVVGCGWEGHRASEDEAAAGAILHNLEELGAELDDRARRVVGSYRTRPKNFLRNNSAARRLKRRGHERDLDFCLSEDTVPVVPCLREGAFVRRR